MIWDKGKDKDSNSNDNSDEKTRSNAGTAQPQAGRCWTDLVGLPDDGEVRAGVDEAALPIRHRSAQRIVRAAHIHVKREVLKW